jgi:hypothetical protein
MEDKTKQINRMLSANAGARWVGLEDGNRRTGWPAVQRTKLIFAARWSQENRKAERMKRIMKPGRIIMVDQFLIIADEWFICSRILHWVDRSVFTFFVISLERKK